MQIAFLGGTGLEGRGLALRLALAGHEALIGSRERGRAEAAAQQLRLLAPQSAIRGLENRQAARLAPVVFLSVPWEGHRELVKSLAPELSGKVVVDVVVPMAVSRGRARAILVEEGSAAQQAQQLLPDAQVVGAFHHVSAKDLLVPDKAISGDVLVCSDHLEAKRVVMGLAEAIRGVRAVDADGLECARYLEEMTVLLLNINQVYKGKRSMVKLTGI